MVNKQAIQWHEVESSNLKRVGIEQGDKPGQVELYVTFKGGAEYVYHGVPATTTRELLDVDSKGKYLNEHVKGVYTFNRLSG